MRRPSSSSVRSRPGQAALEFLSTYGFAFVLILVMIAALSYFGILSPQKLLPGRCLVSSEFSCEDHLISKTATGATISMQLVNRIGNSITVYNAPNAAANSSFGNGLCSPGTSASLLVSSGTKFTYNCTLTGSFPTAGEKVKVAFALNFTETGGAFPRVVSGEVADTIQ